MGDKINYVEIDNVKYRKAAIVIVFNNDGNVLIGKRLGSVNQWQFPQGGIEIDEEVHQAGSRELYEETGISRDLVELVNILVQDVNKHKYKFTNEDNWMKRYKIFGQFANFCIFYFKGINIH